MKDGYGSFINNKLLKDPYLIIKNRFYRDHLYQSSDEFEKIMKDKKTLFSKKEKYVKIYNEIEC